MTTTVTRNPTGDEAVSGTWTGTAGSRYTLVDDYPDTAGTDKLVHGTTTAGNLTFTFSAFSIPSEATNILVAVLYYDDKNGTQACNIGARIKLGANYYNAATHNPANAVFTQRTDTFATNPATSAAWTVAQVNGTDGTRPLTAFGWNSTDANPSIDLTSIQLAVTYDRDLTLVADVGTFTETGQAAGLLQSHLATGETGSFTLSGQEALFERGSSLRNLTLTADAATFTESGQDAGLQYGRLFIADAGAYALSGQAAGLIWQRTLTADAGASTRTGQAAGLDYGQITTYALIAGTGSITVGGRTWATGGWDTTYWGDVGENAQLVRVTFQGVSADAGAFTLSGQTAGLQVGYYLSGGAGTFTETGQAATFVRGYVAIGAAAAFTTTGQSAGTLRGAQASGDAAAFTTTGQAAGLLRGYVVAGEAGSFTLSGQSAGFNNERYLACGAGAFTVSGQAADLIYAAVTGFALTAEAGSFAATGQAAGLQRGVVLAVEPGAFSLTGEAAGFNNERYLAAGVAAFVLSGEDAALLRSNTLSADAGSYTFTGQEATFGRVQRRRILIF